MYVFSRSISLANGNTRDSALWVASITEKVNQITDLNVAAWRTVFSGEINRISWVTFVDDLGRLETADDKLQADDGFVREVDRGAAFVTGAAADALGQVIHGSPDPERAVEYASTVSALMAPGKFMRGIELGVEIAERAEQITGEPTMLVAAVTGDYSAIQWLTAYDSVHGLQLAGEKLNANPSFTHFVDNEVPGVYESGLSVTQQTCYRRVM